MTTAHKSRASQALRWSTVIWYLLSALVSIGIFLVIRHYGEGLAVATDGAMKSGSTGLKQNLLMQVLIALVAVIITGRILARAFSYVGQPPVIGEVVAGILLGPSLLGVDLSAWIMPKSVAPSLGVIAQLGVVLYMFIVGLEFNVETIQRRARVTLNISNASIVLPFLLGMALALYLYPRLGTAGVPFISFALFMGIAMSITAFPVLARILTDRRMASTELGVVALSCAAANDVTAWCLLALVVGVAQSAVGDALYVVVGAVIYIATMLLIARPWMAKAAARWNTEHLPRGAVTFVFLAVLVSALVTEAIGIHAIFGAFLLGVIIPHDSPIANAFTRKLEPIVTTLLLPAFFAFTGMRTQIGLVSGMEQWAMCGLIILVATLGKFGGTYVAARGSGLDSRNAAALGALMNTRGLMELIVLNIGLDLGVISPMLFAMMVLMALITTMMTAPGLRWLVPHAKSA